TGRCIALASNPGEIKIPEQVQAVVVGHYDDIMISGKVFAIIREQVIPAAPRVPAAVHKNHDSAFTARTRRRRRPDIQSETILASNPAVRAIQQKCILIGVATSGVVLNDAGSGLRAGMPVTETIANTGPRFGLFGR